MIMAPKHAARQRNDTPPIIAGNPKSGSGNHRPDAWKAMLLCKERAEMALMPMYVNATTPIAPMARANSLQKTAMGCRHPTVSPSLVFGCKA